MCAILHSWFHVSANSRTWTNQLQIVPICYASGDKNMFLTVLRVIMVPVKKCDSEVVPAIMNFQTWQLGKSLQNNCTTSKDTFNQSTNSNSITLLLISSRMAGLPYTHNPKINKKYSYDHIHEFTFFSSFVKTCTVAILFQQTLLNRTNNRASSHLLSKAAPLDLKPMPPQKAAASSSMGKIPMKLQVSSKGWSHLI